jgi:O-antigen ligase
MNENPNNILSRAEIIDNAAPHERFYSNFALATFIIFLFFIFFGTKMPFGEKITEAENIATSNVTNQIVFGTLFICSIVLLIPKKRALFNLIKREKFLTIFLIWCLVTIIWSSYSFVSLKRYIQYLAVVTICLSVFLHVKDYNKIITVFKNMIAVYLIISLATILTIPGALDRFGIWRGVAPHKNTLGQISLISVIFLTAIYMKQESLKSKTIISALIVVGIVLLFGSKSSTSIVTFLILFSLSATLIIDKIFDIIGIRRTVSLFLTIVIIVIFILMILLAPEVIEAAVGQTGKDLTFTGRVDLWADIWEETKKHLFQGAGFQGYWVVTSAKVEQLYEVYPWLPIQAHNGYLDIINEVGIIGLAIFLLILINYFVNLAQTKEKQIWQWFIFASLIINFTESALIRPKVIMGVVFIFSYIAMFADISNKEKLDVGLETQHNKSLNS